jgi:hypothetical protein
MALYILILMIHITITTTTTTTHIHITSTNHTRQLVEGRHSRIAAQQVIVRKLESGKDGRRAKRGARLTAAVGAVADVEGERLGRGRAEPDGAALTSGVHDERPSEVSRYMGVEAMKWMDGGADGGCRDMWCIVFVLFDNCECE